MPKTRVRPYRRKDGTYVRGHSREQRTFGAFAPKDISWVTICLMACFTPLFPIALPILLILLIPLLVGKICDLFDRKHAQKNKQNRSNIKKDFEIFNKSIDLTNIKYEYLANINSRTFHHHSCKWAKQISPQNLVFFEDREEAEKSEMTPCRFCKPSLKDEVKRLQRNALPKERELKDKKIKCEKCNYEPELRNLLPIINQQSRCPECGETIHLCVGKSGKYDYKNERTIVERLLDVTTSEQRRKLREDIVRRIKEGDKELEKRMKM